TCTPADAGPSAARKSATIVRANAVVPVSVAGELAALTRYAADVSLGQDFSTRRAAPRGPSSLLRAIASAARTRLVTLRSRLTSGSGRSGIGRGVMDVSFNRTKDKA